MWMWWVWRFWIIGLSLILDRWVSNRRSLWVYVFKSQIIVGICFLGFKSRILVDFWVYVSCWFLGMCFLFCIWLTRDLLLGLCLCSYWKPVCVFVFGWQERSTAGFVFVFLLEIGLCFVFLLDLCSCVCVLVFCVLGLCFVFWVCVLGSMFLLFLFLLFLDLDLDLGFFLKILGMWFFVFNFFYLVKINKLIFLI